VLPAVAAHFGRLQALLAAACKVFFSANTCRLQMPAAHVACTLVQTWFTPKIANVQKCFLSPRLEQNTLKRCICQRPCKHQQRYFLLNRRYAK
jgi:hypothetical protein